MYCPLCDKLCHEGEVEIFEFAPFEKCVFATESLNLKQPTCIIFALLEKLLDNSTQTEF